MFVCFEFSLNGSELPFVLSSLLPHSYMAIILYTAQFLEKKFGEGRIYELGDLTQQPCHCLGCEPSLPGFGDGGLLQRL